MAFNDAPSSFFGAGYALASSAISFPTATDPTGVTVGTTFTGAATGDLITTASAHGLLVGDRVQCTAGTGALPTGISAATNYWVLTVPSTTTLTLSATRGGSTLDITANGGTAHILKSFGCVDALTDTDAHATTGDWRKVLFGLMEMLYYKWTGTASADRPAKVTVSRGTRSVSGTEEVTYTYTVAITLTPTAVAVSAE